jgi:hypothetical protein
MHLRSSLAVWLAIPAAVLACAAAGAASFEERIVAASPPNDPWMKSFADLNGDGLDDPIVCGREGPLVWYESPGFGIHTIATAIGTAGASNDIAIGDVDKNGSPDVVLGNGVWFANPAPSGNPETGTWVRHDIDAAKGHDVLLADFDGDDDLDLVKRWQGATGNVIRVFRQNSVDAWAERVITTFEGEGLAVGDVDRDGDPDIVISGYWYENDGDPIGGEWQQHRYTTAYTHPHTVVKIGFVDGDARPDIVVSPSEKAGDRSKIAWFPGPDDPEGTWTERIVDADVEAIVHAVALADYDGDGRTDIALAEMHQSANPDVVRVMFQTSPGTFVQEILSEAGSHNLQTGDADGDGRVDLFGANHRTSDAPDDAKAKIWMNRTDGGPPPVGSVDPVCAKRLLREAGRRCRRELRCHAGAVAKPATPPDACFAGAAEKFDAALAAIAAKAPECAEPAADLGAAADATYAGLDGLAAAILEGADPTHPASRTLHATLLRSSADLCDVSLAAHSRNARSPNGTKLGDALAKARERALRKGTKAVDRAAAAGVVYAGMPVASLADAVGTIVDALLGALSPEQPEA